jgi:hypothetical protein
MRSPSCMLSIYPHLSSFECLNKSLRSSVCMSLRLNPSQRHASSIPPFRPYECVCLVSLLGKGLVKCIPTFGARQRLCKPRTMTTDTCNNTIIDERFNSCAIRVLWKRVCGSMSLSLLGNNSVKTFPRQRRIAGGVVFTTDLVVRKENRQLVLPITYSSAVWGMDSVIIKMPKDCPWC